MIPFLNYQKQSAQQRISSAIVSTLFLLLFTPFIWADCGADESKARYIRNSDETQSIPLAPEKVINRRRISDLQLSHDSKRIAMVVTEPVKGTERISNIWVYDLREKDVRKFTTSKKSDRHPRLSPDGKSLAFLSSREGDSQIFILSMSGGEAQAVTESKTSIRSFEWSPDGTKIAFLSADPKTEEEEKKLEAKDDAYVVDRDIKDPRLRILDVSSGEVKPLTRDKLRISEFVWMPNGAQFLLSATDHLRRDLNSNRLYLLTVSDLGVKEIETPAGPFRNLSVSDDGRTLVYLGARTADGPSAHDLFKRPLSGGKARNLTGSSVDQRIFSYTIRKDGSILFLAVKGFTTVFFTVDGSGRVEELQKFEVHPSRSFAANSKVLAFVGETATQASELWISLSPKKAEKVTHFNKDWDNVPLIQPEIVRYPSFDGKEIEAALLRPAGYKKGTQVPFVVLVHGGPAGIFSDSFHAWSQLLAARGYAVLLPNIRGSLGYGHDFLISNRYDWGGGDWKDVMAGVDFVIKSGIADPERLGIGGWSYGGYMAAWAVTQTDRFKASVSGAPMTDLASEFGTESNGVNIGDTWALGTPYENLDLFIKRSPVTFVKNVKTPTLLLNGMEDPTDPIGQCQQFYRGLRRYNVETEFVAYPRMGHGPREEKHQLDVLNRMINWFEKYLKQ